MIPKGSWVTGASVDWSANRNVTFIFEPGAVIDHGAFTVDLPEKVAMEPGAKFTGTGAITADDRGRDRSYSLSGVRLCPIR